eukprot:TRINITY_DN14277_c0_g1_i1.p3 TRINITY_DN14277_c0_g1~~TRINITY_DN14277_c0_g1_i1.p3  ORF type:complete len:206 (+),score=64.84 TRINITY_DN14277_c0_g1_i1:81-620(+)
MPVRCSALALACTLAAPAAADWRRDCVLAQARQMLNQTYAGDAPAMFAHYQGADGKMCYAQVKQFVEDTGCGCWACGLWADALINRCDDDGDSCLDEQEMTSQFLSLTASAERRALSGGGAPPLLGIPALAVLAAAAAGLAFARRGGAPARGAAPGCAQRGNVYGAVANGGEEGSTAVA